MKKIIIFIVIIILVVTFNSCSKSEGGWDDIIHLSAKKFSFNANGDSVTIKTGGDWWWISDVSVDDTWYYGFAGVDLQSDCYIIKQNCFDVERRDKNTLFIKVDANPNSVERVITVGLQAGNYFDRVTITQKAK